MKLRTRRSNLMSTLIAFSLIVFSNSAIAAPKTDILIFKNGDRLTGEIKSLKRGRVNFNTDATGTIAIEWNKVASVISDQYIQVETNSGARFFGQLKEASKDGRIVVDTENGPQTLDASRVNKLDPIDQATGLHGFDVDFSVGYNFAKATGVKQATLGLNAAYRTRSRIFSFSSSSTLSDSNSQEASERHVINFQFTRLWRNRWTSSGSAGFEQNDELGLELRSSVGFSGGRFLIQNNTMLLRLDAGLQLANENLIAEPEDIQSVEAVFTVDWDWFRFDDPELDWSTTLQLIPSLTESGRIRAEFDTGLKWEIIGDLDWGITLYSSFDNQPQSQEGATNDYGINTTLTYEF